MWISLLSERVKVSNIVKSAVYINEVNSLQMSIAKR